MEVWRFPSHPRVQDKTERKKGKEKVRQRRDGDFRRGRIRQRDVE